MGSNVEAHLVHCIRWVIRRMRIVVEKANEAAVEAASTVQGGLSSIITVSTRWMYPLVHSMFGRTIFP